MARAWVFQDYRQRQRHGDKAPWAVGWIAPDGRRRSKRIGSRSLAEKAARKLEGELAAGTYQDNSRATWERFIAEYESRIMAGMEPRTREATQYALNHWARIIRPKRLASITTATVDLYIAQRRTEQNKKNGRPVSPATINKELRTIRAVLRKAVKWGYLAKCPDFGFLREPTKLPTYVPPEHFQALYAACDAARWPDDCGPFSPAEWWRGLLVMAYMTGWRIGALLALRWEDVDLEAGTAISRAADNKGKRDQIVPLHPLVIEHLRPLQSFYPTVFPWPRSERAVFSEFGALQKAAGVKPIGGKLRYGFHDLRRAFATLNAERLTPDALQRMMQHRDYQTTQRYINMAQQMHAATDKLFVPAVARKAN